MPVPEPIPDAVLSILAVHLEPPGGGRVWLETVASVARELRLARARLAYIASHGGMWERMAANGHFDPLLLRAIEVGASLAASDGPSAPVDQESMYRAAPNASRPAVDPGASSAKRP